MLKTEFKTITANEHPIRHFAHANHGVIVEHENVITGNFEPCRECLYYYNEIGQLGYCVVRVETDYKITFIVELEAQYPDHLRKQKLNRYTYNSYQEAKQKALELIQFAEKWLKSDWWKDLPITFVDQKIWDEHREHMKKVMHDGTMVVRLVSNDSKLRFNIDPNKYRHNEYFKVKLIK